jgi:hypothetical protein
MEEQPETTAPFPMVILPSIFCAHNILRRVMMSKLGMRSFYTPTPYELRAFLTNAKNYHRNVFV